MKSHTPGPWKIGSVTKDDGTVFNPDHVSTANAEEGDTSICQVYGIPLHVTLKEIENSGTWDQGLADARLIAAAPDLLEALQRLTGLIRDCHNVFENHSASWIMRQESFNLAEAAIAKAKGE